MPKDLRKRLVFLASRSRDGNHISDLFSKFGMTPVRGSSTKGGTDKGGARALVELRRKIREGYFAVITPDGPRGPRYECQPGIAWLASKAQTPIVPIILNYKHRFELKNWDHTQIGWPFTYCEIKVGDPIEVPKDLTEDQLQVHLDKIRDGLNAICEWERDYDVKTD